MFQKKVAFEHERIAIINNTTSSAEFWKAAKYINGQTNIISTSLKATQLKDHFSNLLNSPQISPPVQYAAPLFTDDYLDRPFSIAEIKEVIDNSKNKKAPGDDRIPCEFYKNCTFEFMTSLLVEFNRIFDTAHIPDSFKKTIIYPLHKKGDYNDPANYRGISFLNTSAKLFAALIFNRLTCWVKDNKVLWEYQAGFRKNYSTVDQIFALINIAEIYKQKHKKLYTFFVDFRAAFDTIARETLFYKLYRIGISTKIINILREMYKNNVAYVWDGESVSGEFTTTMGVKQGCILSSLLFILFINDITEAVKGGIEFFFF